MSGLIKNLRGKPEKERRRIVLFVSLFITLTIIVFWAISLPQKFSLKEEQRSEVATPTNAFFDILSSTFKSLKESF